jgi:hypothetical protein
MKSGSFKIIVKTDAMVDAYGMYISDDLVAERQLQAVGLFAYTRGLCTLLVLL